MSDDPGRPTPPDRMIGKGKWIHRSILGKNKVYFIQHALDRMKQRGVFENEVFNAIKDPAEIGLPTQPGRKRVKWYRSERTAIDVTYEEFDDHFRIISVNRVSVSTSAEVVSHKKTPKTKQTKPRRRGRRR